MATKGKGQRQQAVRRARIAAAAAAAEHARRRRRRSIAIGALVVLVAALVLGAVAVNASGSKSSKVSTASGPGISALPSSTLPQQNLPSAAGKPCVTPAAPTDGGPPVPVPVGPPPTSLVVQDLKEGDGPAATATDTLNANYVVVMCSTGKVLDSSYAAGHTIAFPLGDATQPLLPGFQSGLVGMKAGGERLIGIPPDQGYGSNPPQGSGIPPDETLWFLVDLASIGDATTTTAAPN